MESMLNDVLRFPHSVQTIYCIQSLAGRVSVIALTKKQRKEQRKMDRKNKANQLRKNKRDMVFTNANQRGCIYTADRRPQF